MGLGYKRKDLRALAHAKIKDACILLKHKRSSNAYYLAGYAVEIGLKACIAAQMSKDTIPDKEIIKSLFSHDFRTLIGLAGLNTVLEERKGSDAEFSANWAIVLQWSPDARYDENDITSAQEIVNAISDEQSGVLKWIEQYW